MKRVLVIETAGSRGSSRFILSLLWVCALITCINDEFTKRKVLRKRVVRSAQCHAFNTRQGGPTFIELRQAMSVLLEECRDNDAYPSKTFRKAGPPEKKISSHGIIIVESYLNDSVCIEYARGSGTYH